ncbi:NAD(P)-dependent oxidoreductase, partial [Streptomyces sp. SID13726]|nr:NAD(P)-dependent oxidoreductase [Streptomyces sp. SID13726]
DDGNSRISYADYAIALADTIESGTAIRRRITVAY